MGEVAFYLFFFFEREQGYTLEWAPFQKMLEQTRENLPAEETYVPRPSKRSILAIFEEEHGDQSGWSSRCRGVEEKWSEM